MVGNPQLLDTSALYLTISSLSKRVVEVEGWWWERKPPPSRGIGVGRRYTDR